MEKVGEVAYILSLPDTTQLHPIFHVSQLKKASPANIPSQQLPDFVNDDWELQVNPETVLATRKLLNGTTEVLIKWAHLPDFDNTWENFELVQKTFPDFHLEDKVKLIGEGIDGPLTRPLAHVYGARQKGRNRGRMDNGRGREREDSVGKEGEGCNRMDTWQPGNGERVARIMGEKGNIEDGGRRVEASRNLG